MKKILIVEDDSMLSEIYKKKFEKAGKFEVSAATSGTDAIEKAKNGIPDLILLDLVLPEMDGFDVVKELRKNPSLNNTKIVPFSNLSQEDNRKKLDGLDIDGFIAKSEHTPQELVVEVERILAETSREAKKEEKEVEKGALNKNFNEDQLNILMADDDEFFLNVFGKKLEEIGFGVERTKSGKDALDLLAKNEFKGAILGVTLSDSKAKEIITQFKTDFPKKNTQFIVLIDNSESSTELEELKKMGIRGIIDKDKIDPNHFGTEMKKILS